MIEQLVNSLLFNSYICDLFPFFLFIVIIVMKYSNCLFKNLLIYLYMIQYSDYNLFYVVNLTTYLIIT